MKLPIIHALSIKNLPSSADAEHAEDPVHAFSDQLKRARKLKC